MGCVEDVRNDDGSGVDFHDDNTQRYTLAATMPEAQRLLPSPPRVQHRHNNDAPRGESSSLVNATVHSSSGATITASQSYDPRDPSAGGTSTPKVNNSRPLSRGRDDFVAPGQQRRHPLRVAADGTVAPSTEYATHQADELSRPRLDRLALLHQTRRGNYS